MKSFFVLSFLVSCLFSGDFKSGQIKNERVKNAYLEKAPVLETRLRNQGVAMNTLQLYLQAFKHERVMAVWVKNKADKKYKLLGEIPFCTSSGRLGPKSKKGDGQIPEGYYFIDRFHPESIFHLSLGLNYPNAADRARSKAENLGGDIFIHGKCQSIGCIAITDEKIKELYVLTVEAQENGQEQIPVHIFPARLSSENVDHLTYRYREYPEILNLWEQLKTGYDHFEKYREVPVVTFQKSGNYQIR